MADGARTLILVKPDAFERGLTGEVLARFQKVLVPEMNLGQLAFLLRGHFLKDVITYSKVQGLPFTRQQIFDKILEIMEPNKNVH